MDMSKIELRDDRIKGSFVRRQSRCYLHAKLWDTDQPTTTGPMTSTKKYDPKHRIGRCLQHSHIWFMRYRMSYTGIAAAGFNLLADLAVLQVLSNQ